MKAVILAGGLGTRLSEETSRIPKPMVEIGGMPIIWHIMKTYSHYGINDFIIPLGYKGYIIKEYFSNYSLHNCDVTLDIQKNSLEIHKNKSEPWRITLVETGLNTQTGGRLRRVKDYLEDKFFCFTYGDGLCDVNIADLVEFHKNHGKLATITATRPPGRWGVLNLKGDSVLGFSEKVDNADSSINGGFFVLSPKVVDYISDDESIWEREPMEGLVRDGQMVAYRHDGFWKAMDTLREKNELESLWSTGEAPWKVWH